ncbi:integrase [Sinorhizobium fredii]|uniref:site-specific integrase n=1 Tax=Rhizobium fredii TaxID=380 RepID=UPI0035183661
MTRGITSALDYATPSLPEVAVTRDGAAFDPRPDRWSVASLVQGNTTFDFARLSSISDEMRHKIKLVILWHLQNSSFSHAFNQYSRFRAFHDEVLAKQNHPVELVVLGHILNYRGTLSDATEWKLGVIRILFESMQGLGIGIVSMDGLAYLGEATIKANVKGTSIRTRDPNEGAFSDLELLAIQSALNNAYAKGDIELYPYALAWLFLGYGSRAVQIAALKERDLVVSESDGEKLYALMIPRAKRRGMPHRSSLKMRYCSKQVGLLLEQVIQHNSKLREKLGLVGKDWPMFMSPEADMLPGLKYHMSSLRVGRMLIDVLGKLTGLKTNSKRFRITLAQRAVDDGKDQFTVAEMLDHSDTQSVKVYFEASPALVLRLDRHLAMELAPLAQAFAGVLVGTEGEALRGGDRSSRIYNRTLIDNVNDPLGTCGQMSFCGLLAPVACYTCRHFQPWLNGPHEQFMSALIADRKRMEEEGISPKVFTIRDRTILAIAEVIQLCAAEFELRGETAA